jgi:tetratricopeptide (TPR) repeat protein
VVGSASDLLGMQDQLARHVAAALKLQQPARKTPTPSGLETAILQEHYVQALGLLQRFDKPASVDEALRILGDLAGQAPASALVFAALSRANLRKYVDSHEKSWADEARKNCDKALELDSQLPEVHVTLGQLLTRTGQPLEGISHFQAALKQQPHSIDAVLGLAGAYQAVGRSSDAESSYRRALALQPGYWVTYNQFGNFYHRAGRYAEAAQMFQRVVALTPDNARAHSNLGGEYLLLGDYVKARDAFQASIRISPSDGAYSNLGTLEFAQARYKEAADAFERAIEINPETSAYWLNLGDAYRWIPDSRKRSERAYERAIQLAHRELSINDRWPLSYWTLGLSLAKAGQMEEGMRQVQKAIQLEPSNPEFLLGAAVVSNLLGKREEAIDWIRRAVSAGMAPAQIERDPEFQNLRGRESFQQALRTAKKIA